MDRGVSLRPPFLDSGWSLPRGGYGAGVTNGEGYFSVIPAKAGIQ
jgi:hypothetical protein